MLKSDLINILITKRGITQKQAEATIETIFESMKEALCRGENIEIRGLGAFHVKNYQGYQGRNPKTGEVIPVKPKRGLLFRTGKELRDRVNRTAAETAAAEIEAGVRTLNRALVALNFRREPVYLPDNSLEMQPRYRRYAIACRNLPFLRALRSSYRGRAIHTNPQAWSRQVDAFLGAARSRA